MVALTNAVELNLIGKFIYNVLYNWVSSWDVAFTVIGAFGVTVILFTVILKLIVSPLDLWQKHLTRKNAKIMKRMKPEMEKLEKMYAGNKEQLMLKQRELNKKYKYSPMKACLPSIITLVIFFVVFSGFRSAVSYHNFVVYENVATAYQAAEAEVKEAGGTVAEMKAAGEAAAIEAYKPEQFLLTKNIFMPDTWEDPVPSAGSFMGTGWGKLGISGIDATDYEKYMGAVIEKYNGSGDWNGYLMLPIIALLLNIGATLLMKPADQPQVAGQTEQDKKSQQASMKMMQFVMPVMMLVFALFYSAAFTLYMVVNSFITLMFNLTYNLITKRIDKKEEEDYLNTTLK